FCFILKRKKKNKTVRCAGHAHAPYIRLPSKVSPSFSRSEKESGTIFSGGVYVGENTSRGVSG
ncbi:MAG: hypothetical protein IJA73_03805, partial [Oscillospiraceae bacterium]|nr:hypothetical protein [Oscillospiraceae bacterium]